MVALACLNSVNIPFTYQTDEEHHPEVVDGEPQGTRTATVALAGGVGPRQRDQNANGQQEEVINHEGERRDAGALDRSDIDTVLWHEVVCHRMLPGLTSLVSDR